MFCIDYPQIMNKRYNGWKNCATWNVAFWLQNDENLYRMACDTVRRYPRERAIYSVVREDLGLFGTQTPDGVNYNDPSLSKEELNSMLRELVS